MKKLSEVIDYIKAVRKNTPDTEASCKHVQLKDGSIDVFKLSYPATANIILEVSGSQYLFQIEDKGEGRVAVYPPNGKERSVNSQFFDSDNEISCLKELKADHRLIDILIKNIQSLH